MRTTLFKFRLFYHLGLKRDKAKEKQVTFPVYDPEIPDNEDDYFLENQDEPISFEGTISSLV